VVLAANDEEHKLHAVNDKTACGNIPAQDTLQDQTVSSAGLNLSSCHRIDDMKTEKNDSSAVMLPNCQTPFGSSEKDTKGTLAPTVADVNDLQGEGAPADVTSPKKDTMVVEVLQTDDSSGGSATHLPAALQSTDSNQPADQKGSSENSGSILLTSGNKTEQLEGTLDKNQEKIYHPEAEKNDSITVMLPDRQTPFEPSDTDTKDILVPTEADASDLHSEGAAVDVTNPKQDTVMVETLQTDVIYGSSASHLPASLQSTDLNQPAGGEGSSKNSGSTVFASGEKTEEMKGTLDKNTDYNLTRIQTNDDSHNINVGRCSPSEDKKEDCCARVVDGVDLMGSNHTPAEVLSAVNTDGSDEAVNALSTDSNKDASMLEVTSVPQSNVSGELMQVLPSQSQSPSQSSAEHAGETTADCNIQTTSLVESEGKSPRNSACDTLEGMELAGPKIECTIQMPSPDEKSMFCYYFLF
jgi:hypothetical protein